MAAMTKKHSTPRDRQTRQWLDVVEQLVRQIESWAKNRKWPVHRDRKSVRKLLLGSYRAPVLGVLTPEGQIQVDPVGKEIAGGEGRR